MTQSKAINQQKAFTFFPLKQLTNILVPRTSSSRDWTSSCVSAMKDTEICVHSIGVSPYSLWPWVTTLSFSDVIAKHHCSTPSSQSIHRTKTTSKPAILCRKSFFSMVQMHGRVNIRTATSNCCWRSHAYVLDYTPQRKLETSIFSRTLKIPLEHNHFDKNLNWGQSFREKVPVRNLEQTSSCCTSG